METAIKQIYENLPDSIRVPERFKNRRVEVIWAPLDDIHDSSSDSAETKSVVEELMGSWQGEPLTRPEQGAYEMRKSIE